MSKPIGDASYQSSDNAYPAVGRNRDKIGSRSLCKVLKDACNRSLLGNHAGGYNHTRRLHHRCNLFQIRARLTDNVVIETCRELRVAEHVVIVGFGHDAHQDHLRPLSRHFPNMIQHALRRGRAVEWDDDLLMHSTPPLACDRLPPGARL